MVATIRYYSVILRVLIPTKKKNVLWLTSPEKPAPNDYQIVSKGRTLSNIEALYVFYAGKHSYWHIRFQNGKEYDYKGKDLQIPNHV